MPRYNLNLGRRGEIKAADFLRQNGYRILQKNYKTKIGEIDIVASDKDTLCFVEVKARSGYRFGAPSEAVSRAKQRQISKAALVFLKEKKLLDRKARFDVVCVEEAAEAPRLSLVKNAFELSEDFTY